MVLNCGRGCACCDCSHCGYYDTRCGVDTLNILKKESKIKTQDELVEDMPWEFWSQLLLLIDGWTLEKKISLDDAKFLREMTWKKDKTISDIYMACRGQNEDEAISAFLGLISSSTRFSWDKVEDLILRVMNFRV
ncbi:unnamed protein product [Lathyrus sativus]|nr:unnamed protein product [Lathyrus sativus]